MTFAQFVGSGSTGIIGVINTVVVPVIFALAFLYFVWGVAKYFFFSPSGKDSFSERGGYGEGRQFVLWGILGLVVLFSVWGIVKLFGELTGVPQSSAPPVPQLPTPN